MTTKRRVIVVGLTGNMGSGKTTVLKMCKEHDCETISTDEIVHNLLATDAWVRNKISGIFGKEIVVKNSDRFRRMLADIVFKDQDKLRQLESILHPEIENIVNRNISLLPKGSFVVVEAPLLYEKGWDRKLDVTVLITCPYEIRKKRYLAEHEISEEEFDRRNTLQWNEKEKAKMANYLLDNSGSLDKTKEQIDFICNDIRSKFLERF